jgi:cytochrome P450
MIAAAASNREVQKREFDKATRLGNQFCARTRIAALARLHFLAPLAYIVPRFAWRGTFYALSYDEVLSVLENDAAFPLPFRRRMQKLDCTREVSVLGFDRDADYRRNIGQIMQALPLEDLPALSAYVATRTEEILAGRTGTVDALGDLFIPIILEVAQDYFGLKFRDPYSFHRWTMAISNYTFAGDNPSDSLKTAAMLAGKLTDDELNNAILAAREMPVSDRTVLGRLMRMTSSGGELAMTDGQLRATIAGLLNGFLPNLTVVGFNVLQVLLRQPAAMRIARAAAQSGDDALLQSCVTEALRFRPIDPGRQRRVCPVSHASPSVPAGRSPAVEKACALTILAMFDGRRVDKPYTFNPHRANADNLAFGFGKHWCVGAPIALCILVQVIKPLLRLPGLRIDRTARLTEFFLGFFPLNLGLAFDKGKK